MITLVVCCIDVSWIFNYISSFYDICRLKNTMSHQSTYFLYRILGWKIEWFMVAKTVLKIQLDLLFSSAMNSVFIFKQQNYPIWGFSCFILSVNHNYWTMKQPHNKRKKAFKKSIIIIMIIKLYKIHGLSVKKLLYYLSICVFILIQTKRKTFHTQ